jgi:RHS repeat-associated protein
MFYDGWLPMVLAQENSFFHPGVFVLTELTWGSDLSGSMQGAGGIGGLLFERTIFSTYNLDETRYRTFDAVGNTVYSIKSDGTSPRKSLYSPYGNAPLGGENFGFSTKYITSNGFSYFGYRFYSSGLGRWLNRDPIEERGGMNLYGYVNNQPVNSIDPLGLCICGPDIDSAYMASLARINIRIKNMNEKPGLLGLFWVQRNGINMDFLMLAQGCGVAECQNTVRLCGKCVPTCQVHNMLYGFVTGVVGLPQEAAICGAEVNNLCKRQGFEGQCQRSAYLIGREIAKYIAEPSKPVTEGSFCSVITGNNLWWEWIYQPNKYANCKPCSKAGKVVKDFSRMNWN